jgi:hypothetical protein
MQMFNKIKYNIQNRECAIKWIYIIEKLINILIIFD